MLNTGKNVSIIEPPPETGTMNPYDVVGFRVFLTINDQNLNVETLSAHQRREIKYVIAAEFELAPSSIIMITQTDEVRRPLFAS